MTGERPGSWGLRIGAFERHYSGWKIESDGARFSARRKVSAGRGPRLTGRTLDELGDKIDAAEEGGTPRDT